MFAHRRHAALRRVHVGQDLRRSIKLQCGFHAGGGRADRSHLADLHVPVGDIAELADLRAASAEIASA